MCVCECVYVCDGGLGVGNDCPPVSAQSGFRLTIMQWQHKKNLHQEENVSLYKSQAEINLNRYNQSKNILFSLIELV